MNGDGRQFRVIAFAEPPVPERSGPIMLQVYIVNESSTNLGILNDLDSINIPQSPDRGDVMTLEANSLHIDFGVSESATFVQVPPGECVKVTLLLREEQLALLARVKSMSTAVKFRDGGHENSEAKTALLQATVYKTNP
ncbi:MAG: hypothetical protein JOZ96_19950 [Acidobacteria bacterium]|nr:hypothetical protein [Acidobacteriota bacterium]